MSGLLRLMILSELKQLRICCACHRRPTGCIQKLVFAFEIDSAADDQASMNVKFYWLKSAIPQPKIALDSSPSLRLRRPENYGLCVYGSDENNSGNIESGDIVKLTTDDPVKVPLPHSKLIELQWLLNSVAALSGAAEADDSWCPDDEDDDNDWPIGVSGYNFVDESNISCSEKSDGLS